MHSLLTRHAIQVQIDAGLTQTAVAEHCKVSERTVRRVSKEDRIVDIDDAAEHKRRGIGRPSKTAAFEPFVQQLLKDEPDLMSLEILRRAKLQGYEGGKSAMYELIASLRDERDRFSMRFEGLPGEFSQHDFGTVWVKFIAEAGSG